MSFVWPLMIGTLIVPLCLVMNGTAAAQEKTVIILGTATPGGGFPLYGAAFAETINEIDTSLSVQPRNTKGSTENVPLLEAGKLDIGQATGEVTYEAITGIGRPPANLRILSAMYSQSGMFVVLARYVMDGLGLDLNKDFEAVYLDQAADGPAMVLDGRVVALWGGGVGWPGFVAVAKGAAGARFIAPDADEIKRITAKHSFLKPITLPAGSYPKQDAPVASVGSWAFVLARPTLPDDVAYRLVRALHRGEAALGARLAQARESTLANTVAAAPRVDLIHPGAQRYLREIGLLR